MGGGATKSYVLQRSVVSASGFAQDIKDAPASISIITKQELEDRPYRDLGQALLLIPGVSIDQETTGITGSNISIRGMPPQYTLILIDGKRQNVTPMAFPHGKDSIFSSFIPPLAAIERIEVIKGPMSTIYGSDAIGGVINIITKKNFEKWYSNFNLSSTLQEVSAFSNIYSGSFYTAGPLDPSKHWGIILRGSESYRSFVSANDLKIIPTSQGKKIVGGESLIVGARESNDYNIGGRISFSPSEANYMYADFDHVQSWYNKHPTSSSKPVLHYKNNAILGHLGSYHFGKMDNSIQLNNAGLEGGETYKTPQGKRESRELQGLDVIASSKAMFYLGKNSLVLGGEYWFSSLRDKLLIAATSKDFVYQNNIGLFAENETSITDNLTLTLGLRENYNFAFGFNSSPRAYLTYNANDYLTFKGGLSTGYKVPNAPQLINGAYGYSGTSAIARIHYGNPNLKPESSLTLEASALFENDYIDMGLSGFYNKFSDKILEGKDGMKFGIGDILPNGSVCSTSGFEARSTSNCFIPINVTEAITYGSEIFFNVKPIEIATSTLGLNLNYTFLQTEQTKGIDKGKPLLNVPRHSLNATIHYAFKNLFGVYLRGEFYAQQPKNGPGWLLSADYQGVFTYEGLKKDYPALKEFYNPYFLLHIGAHYNITKHIKANFAIYNLLNESFSDWFDVTYKSGSNTKLSQVNNYNYIHEGRRYFLSLSMEF